MPHTVQSSAIEYDMTVEVGLSYLHLATLQFTLEFGKKMSVRFAKSFYNLFILR